MSTVDADHAAETAAVFVDATYVGTTGIFDPTSPPLGLIVGLHHIEIRASGYRTMTFDAEVTPGQVHPLSGHAAAELINRIAGVRNAVFRASGHCVSS